MTKLQSQIVGLRTLDMVGSTALATQSTQLRPIKKRVFTDEEWRFLNTLTDEDLLGRIGQGDQLIELLHNPAMMNMVPKEAGKVSSNLRFQQDAIRSILASRKEVQNG